MRTSLGFLALLPLLAASAEAAANMSRRPIDCPVLGGRRPSGFCPQAPKTEEEFRAMFAMATDRKSPDRTEAARVIEGVDGDWVARLYETLPPESKNLAFRILAGYKNAEHPKMQKLIFATLKNPDYTTRIKAVGLLRLTKSAEAADLLFEALGDKEENIRDTAKFEIGQLDSGLIEAALSRQLAPAKPAPLAIDEAGKRKLERYSPRLLELVKSSDWETRLHAANALRVLKGNTAFTGLAETDVLAGLRSNTAIQTAFWNKLCAMKLYDEADQKTFYHATDLSAKEPWEESLRAHPGLSARIAGHLRDSSWATEWRPTRVETLIPIDSRSLALVLRLQSTVVENGSDSCLSLVARKDGDWTTQELFRPEDTRGPENFAGCLMLKELADIDEDGKPELVAAYEGYESLENMVYAKAGGDYQRMCVNLVYAH